MNRRAFFSTLAGSAAVVVAAPKLLEAAPPRHMGLGDLITSELKAQECVLPGSADAFNVRRAVSAVLAEMRCLVPCRANLYRLAGNFKLGDSVRINEPVRFTPKTPYTPFADYRIVTFSNQIHRGVRAPSHPGFPGAREKFKADLTKAARELSGYFHRDLENGASGLHFAPLPLPEGIASACSWRDGLYLRGLKAYDYFSDGFVYRFDAVYGWERPPRDGRTYYEKQLLVV